MRDYGKKYSALVGSGQRVSGRQPTGGDPGGALKFVGVVAVIAMLVGVGSSVWFGMALKSGLAQLDKSKQERSALQASSKVLLAERDMLMQQEKVEVASRALGLYPPSEKQIRRP